MAATAAPANLRYEWEGDLQVLYCTIASVSNTNTTAIPGFGSIVEVEACPSTTAAIGATVSGNTVTWAVSAGTPNLICRIAGN